MGGVGGDKQAKLESEIVNTPKFTHDCTSCIFLGHYKEHDLYCCSNHNSPTVIARFSSEGADYASGAIFAVTNPANDCLREALFRALQQGILTISAV